MDQSELSVALVGNPNTGKTTLFNALTGTRQRIGNWPGTTVERREGRVAHARGCLRVVDLPGAYSMAPRSPDQRIALQAIQRDQPDVVVCVLDAANLARNLFLTVQLLETGRPVVIALNMSDVAERHAIEIDVARLGARLDVPIVATVASRNRGVRELVDILTDRASARSTFQADYGPDVEAMLAEVAQRIRDGGSAAAAPARWMALTLLEGNRQALQDFDAGPAWEALVSWVESMRPTWRARLGEDPAIVLADRRYAFIRRLLDGVVDRPSRRGLTWSDRADRALLHPWIGLLLFGAILFLVFQLVFWVAAPAVDGLDAGIGALRALVSQSLTALPLPDWFGSLLVDGALAGVGAVIIFLPNLALLFAALAVLEESGYLVRAAFLMERLMRRAGLSGSAFVPLMLGFGCSVPAVMAARVLDDRRERLTTILITPFMSCSARLAVYVLITGALFPDRAGLVVFLLYATGIGVAFGSGYLFRRTVLRGQARPFIVELPTYHLPAPRNVSVAVWQRTRAFIRRAGTFILAGSVVVWMLGSLPWGVEFGGPDSLIGTLGHWLEPALEPLGLGWREGIALVVGFIAKELVVGGLGVLYAGASGLEALDLTGLQVALATALTPAAAGAFLAFVLLYVPCFATVSAIRAEAGSWRWTGFQVAYSSGVAWLAALAVFHGLQAFGLG